MIRKVRNENKQIPSKNCPKNMLASNSKHSFGGGGVLYPVK